jgi:CheY-like chemotaxis protein
VRIATDSDQAARLATEGHIELLLVGGSSSGLGVVETVKRLKTTPRLVETPVIVVTQSDRDDGLEKALAAGAEDYICHPFSPSVVKARASAVLRTARAQQEMRIARQRYCVAARAAECGLWEWDIVHDRFYLTQPLQQLLMLQGPLPATFDDLVERAHAEDRRRLRDAVEKHLGGYTDQLEQELRIPSVGNPDRWFLCRGLAFRSATGWAERVVGAFVDVSQRKAMETALRDSLKELARAKASIEDQARQLTWQNELLHDVRVELEQKSIQLEFQNRELRQAGQDVCQSVQSRWDECSTNCKKLRTSVENLLEIVGELTASAEDGDGFDVVRSESKNVLDYLNRLTEMMQAEVSHA